MQNIKPVINSSSGNRLRFWKLQLLTAVTFLTGLVVPAGAVRVPETALSVQGSSPVTVSSIVTPCYPLNCANAQTRRDPILSHMLGNHARQNSGRHIKRYFLKHHAVRAALAPTWFRDEPLNSKSLLGLEAATKHSATPITLKPNVGAAQRVLPLMVFGSMPLKVSSLPLTTLTASAFASSEEVGRSGLCKSDTADAMKCKIKLPKVWDGVLTQAGALPRPTQLNWINKEVNRLVRYRSDQALHNIKDVWSPATETMLRGAGDCEDYALVKMWLLTKLGYSIDDLFVIVVDINRYQTRHAVLAVRTASGILILDNLRERVVRESDIADYTPVFSVSRSAIWLHGTPVPVTVATLR